MFKLINLLKEIVLLEIFDQPYEISKIDGYNYYVDDKSGIKIKYTIKTRYDIDTIPNHLINLPINGFIEISWNFGKGVPNELKNVSSWLRGTSTSFKVIENYLKTNKTDVILFSSTDQTINRYRSENFLKLLQSLFPDRYISIIDNDDFVKVYMIDKNVSKLPNDSIEKIMNECDISFLEAKNRLFKPKKTGINKKRYLENKIQSIINKKIYL